MKTKVHVNQHIIKSNATTGHRTPPLTVKNYKINTKAREVFIAGPCRVVYRPDNPLDCGARVWIETDSKVLVDPETSCRINVSGIKPKNLKKVTKNAGKTKNKVKGKAAKKAKAKPRAARLSRRG